MSLVEMIARADARGLAVSGLACLDRCLPLLGGADETLRPLWSALGDGADWSVPLAKIRAELGDSGGTGVAAAVAGPPADPVAGPVWSMLAGVPAERTESELREWADVCSLAALLVHRSLDSTDGDVAPEELRRGAEPVGAGPLVAGELHRQIRILEVLEAPDPGNNLRRTAGISSEGRRIVRAAVARRARSGG